MGVSGASESRESRFRSHTVASRSRPFPEISKTKSGINIIIPIDAGLETGESRFRSATVFSRTKSFPEIPEFHYHEDIASASRQQELAEIKDKVNVVTQKLTDL